MNHVKTLVQRPFYFALAAATLVAISAPALFTGRANAAQVQARSITLSDSTPGATNVTYKVTFTPNATNAAAAVIVDFCSDTPLEGANCAFAANSVPDTSSAAGANVTPLAGGTPTHAVKVSSVSLTNGTPSSIIVTGITNPTNINKTFYARIYVYASNAAATYTPATTTGTAATNVGTYTDFGGAALSTAAPINITARVMETLSFCVYPSLNVCTDALPPTLILGSGTPEAIGTGSVYTGDLKFDLSTNALSGATVTLKGDTLKSGSNSIPAAGAAAVAIVAGTANFGVHITAPAAGVTPTAPYNNASNYGLDTTSTLTTYGDDFASTAGAVANTTSTFQYGVTASNTTPAGIYTTTHQLIATGKF